MNAIEKLLYDKKKKILTLFRSFNHSIFDFIVSKEAKNNLESYLFYCIANRLDLL